MEYNTYQPDSDLETLVKCYWTLNIPKEVPKGRQQVLSDGCMEMIFNLGDDVRRILPNDQYLVQPRSFVLGQITQPMWIEPMGKVETFAVRFKPGGFSYFTKTAMSDLTDKDTELRVLFDEAKVAKIEAAISSTKDTIEKISLIERFLLDILTENIDVPGLLKSVIDKILQTNGTVSIKDITQENSGQRRSLERKFIKQVGTSPKQLCRVIRFQKALKTILDGNKKLTDVGYENEFFDQAHFIKDFKDFTGISPKQFYTDKNFTLSSLLYSKD
ncbi:AraC family transcriptional regulator [marine bacterium AO1-C]|nr:AraC family transcriptional regulator [marine bacterium AO1-C]